LGRKKILVALDGSKFAECIFPHLISLTAGGKPTDIELVTVVTPLEMHYRAAVPLDSREEQQINRAEIEGAQAYLDSVKGQLNSANLNVTVKVLSGRPSEVLAQYLKSSGADLLAITTHGRSGPSRWLLGSVADRLLQISSVPVFIVRPQGACLAEASAS
jgi:nucleotide-binding universal stress UspA family protein